MPRDAVSRTAHVGTVGSNGLTRGKMGVGGVRRGVSGVRKGLTAKHNKETAITPTIYRNIQVKKSKGMNYPFINSWKI